LLSALAFAVALGVLLDTIVIRSVLVTALTMDLGHRMWWPSRLSRAAADPGGGHLPTAPAVVAGPHPCGPAGKSLTTSSASRRCRRVSGAPG
jgi:MMPL family